MQPMLLTLGWQELTLRLALTVVAGALIGINRDEHGRPAGLRTTMLVCLAAAVAMIQANILLPTTGKESDSFVVLDLMRLPLGILSGVGFLGAGAILRRSNLVVGITTAATLWIVTVIGLCFGGGQLALGAAATAIALVLLWGLKYVESYIRRDRQAALILVLDTSVLASLDLVDRLKAEGIKIAAQSVKYSNQAECAEIHYDVQWRGLRTETRPPSCLQDIARRPGVQTLQWRPHNIQG